MLVCHFFWDIVFNEQMKCHFITPRHRASEISSFIETRRPIFVVRKYSTALRLATISDIEYDGGVQIWFNYRPLHRAWEVSDNTFRFSATSKFWLSDRSRINRSDIFHLQCSLYRFKAAQKSNGCSASFIEIIARLSPEATSSPSYCTRPIYSLW